MQFPKHFPLNSVDIVNKPPLHFLQIQDGLQILSGFTWTVAYVLYVKQSYKDRSYGMPIIALCVSLLFSSKLHVRDLTRCYFSDVQI